MGAGSSAERKVATTSATAAKNGKPVRHTSPSAAAAAGPRVLSKPGDTLMVVLRRLRPGEGLSDGVGIVTEETAGEKSKIGLPPPSPRATPPGTVFGWFVADPDRAGVWEAYAKESADRLEDAFWHQRDTCTVVMKKRTYTVDLNAMHQLPAAGGTNSTTSGPMASRSRDVKRVPVVMITDPVTGEVTVKEAPPTLIDPFAETDNEEQDGGVSDVASGAGDLMVHGPVQSNIGAALAGAASPATSACDAPGAPPLLVCTVTAHHAPVYTMECTPPLEQLGAEARAVVEPAGGALVLTGSRDMQLLEWSLDTAKVVTRYELPATTAKNSVLTANYSSTGRWVITGLDDHTARLYSIGNRNEIHRFQEHTHKVYGAGILADDVRAVTASMDSRVKLWDIASGTCIRTQVSHTSHIFALRVHPKDPNFALTGGDDCRVCMHDFRQEKSVVAAFTGHERAIWDMAFNPGDSTFSSTGVDTTICLYDPRVSTEAVTILRHHKKPVHCLAYTPHGRGLLSCSKDQTVHYTDIAEAQMRWQAKAHAATVFRIRLHAGKSLMLTAAGEASVNVWSWSGMNAL